MNKKIVLLITAFFLIGVVRMDAPVQAVEGPFGYDLQKDIHRKKEVKQEQPKQDDANKKTSDAPLPVTDADIFESSVNFNKVYYPNATMKSAVIKYKKGNYTGSLQELYTIVKREPKNAWAYYYVAMAYTKVGGIEQAKAAYQKVIELNSNPVLVDYAVRGKDCLDGGAICTASQIKVDEHEENATDLDKFIAAPYGNGLSPEMNEKYRQQQLNAIQNKINNGQTLSPEDTKRLRDLNNKSEALQEDKLAMADNDTPSNEEIIGALNVLKRAGLNISTQQENSQQVTPNHTAFTPDPQIQQMTMMLNGGNTNYNNDPMMNMLPYMMQNEGKNMDPQLIQAMMMNSMMGSLNSMNNSNNNN